jgi:hypothetical protein
MDFKRSSNDRIRNQSETKNNIRTPMLIMGLVMCIAYLSLGSYILLNKDFIAEVQLEFRNIFAVMLLIYGFYRGYRIYADYF